MYPRELDVQREADSHTITAMVMAKNSRTPAITDRFTFVVRLWTFTSGKPELSFSIDMGETMDRQAPRLCHLHSLVS